MLSLHRLKVNRANQLKFKSHLQKHLLQVLSQKLWSKQHLRQLQQAVQHQGIWFKPLSTSSSNIQAILRISLNWIKIWKEN